MDQRSLKRIIIECPRTDFSENGNVTERQLQLDKYLKQFTNFLYKTENYDWTKSKIPEKGQKAWDFDKDL